MSAQPCPSCGAPSATTDYCDSCGSPMTKAAPAAPPPAATTDCPHCGGAVEPDAKFCEDCGYDFATGTVPTGAAANPTAGGAWTLVASADRDYYDRQGSDAVSFPTTYVERTFVLTDDEVLIGRRSDSRGIHPEVDLTGDPEDTGISRAHCVLLRAPDGHYRLVDTGSTNGTFVNGGADPIANDTPIDLAEGDRVHLGAFTTLTLGRP